MSDWRELARRDGWHVDETCGCDRPQPVIVGGNGYYLPPVMCANCRRRAR